MRSATFVQEARAAAWLTALDPRVKIVWLLVISTLGVALEEAPTLIALAVCGALPLTGLRLTARWWLTIIGLVAFAAWSALLTQALFYEGAPRTVLVEFGPITLWHEGALDGLKQSLRLIGPMLSGVAVCLSTSPERLLAGLVWLRVPQVVAFLTMTALSALPGLIDQWLAVRQAQRIRGYRFRAWGPPGRRLSSWRVELGLFVPLLAAVLRRAQTLAISITARGFDPHAPRTCYPPLRMTRRERYFTAIVLAVGLTIIGVKFPGWWMNTREQITAIFAKAP